MGVTPFHKYVKTEGNKGGGLMLHEKQPVALQIGRVLLGIYFLLPGISKFADWQRHIELMQHHDIGFTAPLLAVAGVANIILGVLLIANRQVLFAAYASVLYVLIINFSLHDFWNFTGVEGQHETQNFVKNLAILAGLLVLAGQAHRR